MDAKYFNCWILPNGRVLLVEYMQHEKGYTQPEIEHNEKHWLKISDGVNINFTQQPYSGDVVSSSCKVTRAQAQKYLMLIDQS